MIERITTGAIVMKPLKTLLKLGVIATSLLLVAGFVAYSAGAFNGWIGTGPVPQGTPSDGTTPSSPQVMYGSKAGVFIDNSKVTTSGEQPPADKHEPKVIMSGSKSLFIPQPITPPGSEPSNPNPSTSPPK
jgi:hypothetical protein